MKLGQGALELYFNRYECANKMLFFSANWQHSQTLGSLEEMNFKIPD